MDNQHKKIKGYRDLSQEEIDLMNRIKELGESTKALLCELIEIRTDQWEALHNTEDTTVQGLDETKITESMSCISVAKTNLQTGQMWFVRAVALPDSF
jgi:molybdate-binding protein